MGRFVQLTTDQLVGRYRAAAADHGRGTVDGKPAETNTAADVVADIYRELRRRHAEEVLAVLLDDPDPGVRGWAGAHALEFAPSDGERVLTALVAEESGLISFSADMTLREWRAGRLRFP